MAHFMSTGSGLPTIDNGQQADAGFNPLTDDLKRSCDITWHKFRSANMMLGPAEKADRQLYIPI